MKLSQLERGEVEIRSDIPVPRTPRATQNVIRKYPFHRMLVGDSFFLVSEEPDARILQQRLSAAARRFVKKHHPKRRYACRKREEEGVLGVRVWRTK